MPTPAEAMRELARIGLCQRDEFGNRLGRNRWADQHDIGRADDGGDRRDVAAEIEAELVVERRIDRARGADHEQRMAIGRRVHDRLGGDIAADARTVIDDKFLTKAFRQRLRASRRAMMSVELPGANPTTIRTGCDGSAPPMRSVRWPGPPQHLRPAGRTCGGEASSDPPLSSRNARVGRSCSLSALIQKYIAACREGRVKKAIQQRNANRVLITSVLRD